MLDVSMNFIQKVHLSYFIVKDRIITSYSIIQYNRIFGSHIITWFLIFLLEKFHKKNIVIFYEIDFSIFIFPWKQRFPTFKMMPEIYNFLRREH